MPSLTELPVSTPTVPTPKGERAAASPVYLPIGLANPIWFAFTAAAGAGAAFWMMTRLVRPINLEALAGAFTPVKVDPHRVGELVETATKPVVEAAAIADSAVAAVTEAAKESPAQMADTIEQVETAAEAVADFAEETADDLTMLVGVGPRTAAALADHGVKSFADLAAWSEDQLAQFDSELGLKGRSLRDGWIEQARALAQQK